MRYLKYPGTVLVVNTAVLLEPDKENLYYLLDMWNAQVNDKKYEIFKDQ